MGAKFAFENRVFLEPGAAPRETSSSLYVYLTIAFSIEKGGISFVVCPSTSLKQFWAGRYAFEPSMEKSS